MILTSSRVPKIRMITTKRTTTMEEGDKEVDGMSPEERLAWLRERGVMVETADDRRRKKVTELLEGSNPVAFVEIPADAAQELKELTFVPKLKGDALPDHLKTFMNADARVDLDLFKSHAGATLAGSADTPSVSDDALRKVAEEPSVETFTLVHAAPSNQFTCVNIYLDEAGMLKRLPVNARASQFAQRAGFDPPPIFYGTVYLAKLQQRPIQHRSLFVDEVHTDAPWLRAAPHQNLEHQKQLNEITGRRVEQPGPAGANGKTKEEDGYSWTQTEQEIEMVVELPTTDRPKVQFRSELVVILGVLNLPLFERVDVDGCTWTKEGKTLTITLEKAEEAFWPRIRD